MDTPIKIDARKSPDYDMIDDMEKIPDHKLRRIVETIQQILFKHYDSSDKAALRNQKYHRVLTMLVAICGTIAVLFAIFQLSGYFGFPWLKPWLESWPMWVEVLAAIIALIAVILGLAQARQTQWLLQRHKAERFRMLKFCSLIHLSLWSNEMAGDDSWKTQFESWKNELLIKVQEIEKLTAKSFRLWLKHDEISSFPSGISTCSLTKGQLQGLVNYYLDKRLLVQKDYFERQAKKSEGIDQYFRAVPHFCFFCSVLAALVHFILDIFFRSSEQSHVASVILILMAASFPVLGAGIRTFRSAHEYARRASIFRAKQAALHDLEKRMQEEENGDEIIRILWRCEQFLENEHREWLRLMIEAEWYL